MALNRKVAYINLTSGKIETRSIPEEIRKKYLGGTGLGAYLLYNHMNPGRDAFGPENTMVVSAGLLLGTPASVSCPVSVCGKSPLTGGYGSCSTGGFFAPEMRWAGFDHLVITGKAVKPVYLWVQNNRIEIRDAAFIGGTTIPESQQAVREKLGDRNIQVLAIGPSGEKMVRFAGVVAGPGTTSCRSGMGAVFGSKNLKAIAARGTLDITMAHPGEILDYVMAHLYNRTAEKVTNTAEGNSGETSPLPLAVAAGTDDTFAILEETGLVARYGLDVSETGSLINWAIELYEEGILTVEDTGGLELVRGNTAVIREMARRIGEREGLGDTLAEGGIRAAEKSGRNSLEYLAHVKGMGLMNPDAKVSPALALHTATSPFDPDRLRSPLEVDFSGLSEEEIRKRYSRPVPYEGPFSSDERAFEGKSWQVFWHETAATAAESLGICKPCGGTEDASQSDYEVWSELLRLVTGLEMSPEDIRTAAERAETLVRMINLREGVTGKDDMPSDRYFTQANETGLAAVRGGRIDSEQLSQMIGEYYRHHGWDESGVPAEETLKKLGLDKEPSHML